MHGVTMCDFMEKLDTLSTAEEIFDVLDVPYERSVIKINRLNILKHFQRYISAFSLEEFNEFEQRHLCRAQLTRAYYDFSLISNESNYRPQK
jgi:nitrogenase-stabilizing/protective protein